MVALLKIAVTCGMLLKARTIRGHTEHVYGAALVQRRVLTTGPVLQAVLLIPFIRHTGLPSELCAGGKRKLNCGLCC